jgi:phosphoribosylformylglycinamidine synthase
MIVLEGLPALSAFRLQRLLAECRAIHPTVEVPGTRHLYLLQPEPGARLDLAAIGGILEGCVAMTPPAPGAVARYVLPRFGTRSPWSSKATEILRGAGHAVARVERGLRLDIAHWPADAGTARRLARVLHDPMTQSLVESLDAAAALFEVPATGAVDTSILPPCRRRTSASDSRSRRTRSPIFRRPTPASAGRPPMPS